MTFQCPNFQRSGIDSFSFHQIAQNPIVRTDLWWYNQLCDPFFIQTIGKKGSVS